MAWYMVSGESHFKETSIIKVIQFLGGEFATQVGSCQDDFSMANWWLGFVVLSIPKVLKGTFNH